MNQVIKRWRWFFLVLLLLFAGFAPLPEMGADPEEGFGSKDEATRDSVR
jgi:hypothetical protein